MRLELDLVELAELRIALRGRHAILDGLVRRAAKRDRLELSRQRQYVAGLIAKVKDLELEA
jgi:hypothetical protein